VRKRQFTTPIKDASTRQSSWVSAVTKLACARQWDKLGIATTTGCASFFSQHSNANSASGNRSPIGWRLASRSSDLTRPGTKPIGSIPGSTNSPHRATKRSTTHEKTRSPRSPIYLLRRESRTLSPFYRRNSILRSGEASVVVRLFHSDPHQEGTSSIVCFQLGEDRGGSRPGV
jgi:hypothetical protein